MLSKYIMTEEHKRKLSEALLGRPGRFVPEEERQRISQKLKGHLVSLETKKLISCRTKEALANPATRARMSEMARRPNPRHAKYMRERWQDLAYRQRQVEQWMASRKVKPNKIEQELISLLEQSNLPFRYVGDGQVIIAGRCPDFINTNGRKQLIELLGVYWHDKSDEETLPKYYSKYGFDTLIIWETELEKPAELITRIKGWARRMA